MKKAKETGNKVKNVILAVAIAIIFALFIGFGISVFYPAPDWDDFCDNDMRIPKATQQECENAGGKWNVYEEKPLPVDSNQMSCTKIGDDGETFTLRCSEIDTEPKNGYCDEDFYCRQDYDEQRESYDRVVFIVTLILGIITILISVWLALTSVSTGLMAGGIITIIYGVIRYWEHSTDVLRFILLGIALAILIWLGYKKLNK
jgi:hypothetical protein